MKKWDKEMDEGVWILSQENVTPRYNILLMAGIHPEEEAGVLCLEEMVAHRKWIESYPGINFIVVPCRNRLGFQIQECVENSTAYNGIIVKDNRFCKMMMTSKGCIVLIKKEMWQQKGRKQFWYCLTSELRDVMEEGFVHIISLKKNRDLRANTYYYREEKLIDVNVIDEYPKTDFICDLKRVIQEYRPDFVIDVHEGKGEASYVYIDSCDESMIAGGRYLINYLEEQHISVRRCASDRKRIADGIFALEELKSGRRMIEAAVPGKVMIVESGIDQNLKHRIKILKKMIEQSITYEWREINGKTCDNPYNESL